jgi:hypothetical protein
MLPIIHQTYVHRDTPGLRASSHLLTRDAAFDKWFNPQDKTASGWAFAIGDLYFVSYAWALV